MLLNSIKVIIFFKIKDLIFACILDLLILQELFCHSKEIIIFFTNIFVWESLCFERLK
jgi:hypothetical protein